MGVLRSSSSCLMKSAQPGRGLRGSSDGRTGPAEQGVLRVGRTGFTVGEAEGMAASWREVGSDANDCDVK